MDVRSTAQRMARATAAVGFGCGVLYAGLGFFHDLYTTGLNAGTAMAFGALLGMPLLFGAAGYAGGAVAALITNALGTARSS